MTKAKIFLVGDSENDLVPMEESAYVTEDHLQKLLARYPDLLPGDQISPENPRRWLLVAREMAVPDYEEGQGRWSLDHLFLDQDGIPTFVECKRASDTRARREVVAQMLDYAANGTQYWGMDRLRQAAAETAQAQGKDLDAQILDLIETEGDSDIETYWQTDQPPRSKLRGMTRISHPQNAASREESDPLWIEANLKAGRVRLLFVTDHPSKELRRLVEFLNEKMADVEVLTIEIKQFLSADGHRAVVPRAIGVTETARRAKETRPRQRHIDRKTFLDNCLPEMVPFFEYVLDRGIEKGHEIYWGTIGFSVRAYLPKAGEKASFVYGYPKATFQFYFAGLLTLPESERQALRETLLNFGIFRERGNYTLDATLDEKNLPLAREAYDLILEKIDDIVQAY